MADDQEPPYRRIVRDVRGRIEAGELRPGDRVPSAREITREWGVAIATATKAHAALRDAGLTVSRPGVGTVVAGPAPRRDRELSLDRIAAAAIVVADRDGFSEVTMRRVAIELGVATMSLYRHVTSRDDLTVAMINAAIGDLRLPPRHPRGWRASLELCARLEWAMFQRHPWLGPSMSLTRPQLALNAMRLSEWVMGAFDGTALSLPERMFVQTTVFSFVRGVASALEPEAEAVRDSGITAEQWMETQETAFSTVMSSADFTYFQRLTQERFDLDLDSLFAFGLARLLDGIETFVRSREERSPGVSDSRRSR